MTDDQILEAIRTYPAVAGEALATLPPPVGTETPRSAAAYDLAAALIPQDRAEYWLEELKQDGQVTAFAAALEARNVTFETEAIDEDVSGFPDEELERFLPRARSFRCRILKNGAFAGSGVLVGPRLVLTAWHVIAEAGPDNKPVVANDLEVVLSDATTVAAVVSSDGASPCGDDEFRKIPPIRDSDVANRNDVALLQIANPVGTRFGFVSLAQPAPTQRSQSPVLVIHYPGGQDRGIGTGKTGKIRFVTARWRHNAATAPGSSGGALFNRALEFVGLHQGLFDTEKRFVPLDRFLDQVLEVVKTDVAPVRLWSLDGTVEGKLVVGRNLLFETVAAAGESSQRVRGVWIKRTALASGATGLAFTHDILEQLLARRGPNHLLVRVTQDEIVPDLVADIRRRAKEKGLAIPEPAAQPGVAPGQAPPETTAKDRAAILAAAVEAAAAKSGQIVWFFFDNPTVALSDGARFGFEGFVDAALVQPHLRVIAAGFETLSMPGQQFAGAAPPEGDRSPGLVVEFIGGFRRTDLVDFLGMASDQLARRRNAGVIEFAVSQSLVGLQAINNFFTDEQLAAVIDSLRPTLVTIRDTKP